jgi:acyl-coenzyme A thioesterase PaaI-like protein
VPTLELKTSFLGAARPGLLYVEARCIKFGRSIAFMEADLKDGDGTILAKMSTTVAPRPLKHVPTLIEAETP